MHRAHLLLRVLLTAAACSAARSIENVYDINNLTNANAEGRYYSLSTQSPITRAVRASAAGEQAIQPLVALFDNLTAAVETRRRNNDSLACGVAQSNPWIKSSARNAKLMQVGELSTECSSRIELELAAQKGELPLSLTSRAPDIVLNALDALYNATVTSGVLPTSTNWTHMPYPVYRFMRNSLVQSCVVDSAFGFRNNGRWYIRAAATNRPTDLFVEKYNRQYVTEFVPESGDDALRMPHKRWQQPSEFELSSTLLIRGNGRASPSFGGPSSLRGPRGALGIAIRANIVAINLAEDSITQSNIAILALPMIMNLVPVSFLAELNTYAMVCYLIFTDVFASLPFLIKGVELIMTAQSMRKSVVALYVGDKTLSQMEIFVAECRRKESYKTLGISFVVIALVLMAVGVWLELYSRKVMRRRKKRGEQGPFGRVFEEIAYQYIGGHDEEEKMRKFALDAIRAEELIVRNRNPAEAIQPPNFPQRIARRMKAITQRKQGKRE